MARKWGVKFGAIIGAVSSISHCFSYRRVVPYVSCLCDTYMRIHVRYCRVGRNPHERFVLVLAQRFVYMNFSFCSRTERFLVKNEKYVLFSYKLVRLYYREPATIHNHCWGPKGPGSLLRLLEGS